MRLPVRGGSELAAVPLVTVLHRGPTLVLLLGGRLENFVGESVDNGVAHAVGLIHFHLRVSSDLMVEALGGLVVEGTAGVTVVG